MHREQRNVENVFRSESPLGLYLLTAIVGGLLAADLWPVVAGWLRGAGVEAYSWQREITGLRYALIAALIGGARILYTSLEALFEGRIGADLALAIAAIAAIMMREPVVAAEVIFIGLVGECLEAFTFARTQAALGKLAELFPTRCWVLRDGAEVRTFTTDLLAGDKVVMKPGGRVPVDGVVLDGRSAVDAGAITGESLPVDKGPGDAILAGSIVENGSVIVEARKVAGETVAGQVIDLTRQALKEKAPLERHADRLARYFLPVVLVLALATFAGNFAFQLSASSRSGSLPPSTSSAAKAAAYPALAVLVVACPCALILATPAAVIAALGRLAGTGVLIKGGSALERLASVSAFAFDKTGTLTEGKLSLGDVIAFECAAEEVLALAAAAEVGSEHPIARLIVSTAAARGLNVPLAEAFEAFPGAGVSAAVNGAAILLGTRRFMVEKGVVLPREVMEAQERLDASGQSSLLVVREGAVLGVIGARDTVRPEAAEVLADLRALGIAPIALLTGDRAAVANAIGEQLPVTEVQAELLPQGKAEWVGSGAGSGPQQVCVAFVGDGINDAPALARAGVGIAIGGGRGTDIAAEAGDIVLMGEPLRPLPLLVKLSRETVRIIRQNIVVFAFAVNIIGVVLTGWLWPLFATSPEWYEAAPLAAVVYHQFASLAVLLNSMRLLAFERTDHRTISRARETAQRLEGWLERFSFDQALHSLAHRWKSLAGLLAATGILAWFGSCFAQVESDEVGVVRRFGEVKDNLQPGLHFRWPWPVETVTRVRPREIRTIEIGFRANGRTSAGRSDNVWTSGHDTSTARHSDESVMITGDGDLIDLLATVRYRANDPRRYLLASANPDDLIRSCAESVLRELVASQRFLELLTVRRAELEATVLARLQQRLADAVPEGLGITFDGCTIHDLHPPPEVVGSYHLVAQAIQERDRMINEAAADALRQVRRSEEEANRLVKHAQAEAHARLEAARADRDAFLAWHRVRAQLGEAEETALAAERKRRIKAGEDAAYVDKELAAIRQSVLEERRALIETRLTYETLVDVLRQRDKVFIDAADVPGRRHLFLMDPDLLRLPPLLVPSKEKEP